MKDQSEFDPKPSQVARGPRNIARNFGLDLVKPAECWKTGDFLWFRIGEFNYIWEIAGIETATHNHGNGMNYYSCHEIFCCTGRNIVTKETEHKYPEYPHGFWANSPIADRSVKVIDPKSLIIFLKIFLKDGNYAS